MSSRKLWILAVIGDFTAGMLCFVVHGFNAAGAGSATRNTARFAICFLLTGFAAPGLRKWFPAFPEPAGLIRAYMAAQFVHFGFVANLHLIAVPTHIGMPQVVVALLGFTLVALTGFTAARGGTGHVVLLYINWLILAVDYSKHPNVMMRLVAIPVFLALILRWLPRTKTHEAKIASA